MEQKSKVEKDREYRWSMEAFDSQIDLVADLCEVSIITQGLRPPNR